MAIFPCLYSQPYQLVHYLKHCYLRTLSVPDAKKLLCGFSVGRHQRIPPYSRRAKWEMQRCSGSKWYFVFRVLALSAPFSLAVLASGKVFRATLSAISDPLSTATLSFYIPYLAPQVQFEDTKNDLFPMDEIRDALVPICFGTVCHLVALHFRW